MGNSKQWQQDHCVMCIICTLYDNIVKVGEAKYRS